MEISTNISLDNAVIAHLAHIKLLRPCVYVHAIKTADSARIIAATIDLHRDTDVAYTAGLLHDIGKVSTPEVILQKQGKLTTKEMQIVQKHPLVGAELLKGSLAMIYTQAVLQHHELPDGSGYPAGLRLDDICNLARIVNIADRFAAMTEDRAYRPALLPEYVVEVIRPDAKLFFPAEHVVLLDALVQFLRFNRQPQPAILSGVPDSQCFQLAPSF